MNEVALTQYYFPMRNADIYSYNVKLGDKFVCFHNLDELSEDEEPLLVFCSAGFTNPSKLYQTVLVSRKDDLTIKQSDQSHTYAGLRTGDYIITSAWDYHSKTGTESLIVNILRVDRYLNHAEANVVLEDRYYYESSMPFRCRYAEQWLSNFEKRELAPFTEELLGRITAQGKRMEEIRHSKKPKS